MSFLYHVAHCVQVILNEVLEEDVLNIILILRIDFVELDIKFSLDIGDLNDEELFPSDICFFITTVMP